MHIQKVSPPEPPSPRVWTTLELIGWTKGYFERKSIESPRLEAELLLAAVLECPRIRLYVDFEKPVPQDKLARFRELVKRRGETREPLQYVLGSAQFLELQIKVNRHVLIPRPETELLAVWALERVQASLEPAPQKEVSVPPEGPAAGPLPEVCALDLCTGSGCLGLYVAAKDARVRLTATDISAEALAVATENAAAFKTAERVRFLQGDLFAALPSTERNSFDLLVANPPYIDPALRPTLQPEVRDHEPAQALFADERGLSVSKRILGGAGEWLKAGGWLGLEFGLNQAEELRLWAEQTGTFSEVEIRHDHARLPRFLTARRR